MRLRLISAFLITVGATILSLVLIMRFTSAREIEGYIRRGGINGVENLVIALEDFYEDTGNWSGVNTVFDMPGQLFGRGTRGMGSGQNSASGFASMKMHLTDTTGKVLFSSNGNLPANSVTQDDLSTGIPLLMDDQTVGYLLIEGTSGINIGSEDALIARLNQAAFFAAIVAGALAIVLAFILAYRLIKPIQSLTEAARQMAAGDRNQRVPVTGDDEISILSHSFNEMAASIQAGEEIRRGMTADIAHELRNPLAIQQAHLEALADDIYPLTKENLEPITVQNQLLRRLVNDLHTIALAKSGHLGLELAPTSLPDLIRKIVAGIDAQINTRNIRVNLDIDPTFPPINLDPQRVEQILINLMSNTIRFTPPHGDIWINLIDRNGKAILTLRDSGPGIAEDALPNLFERFFRADRSRDRRTGGSGLGLSIARELARAHNGDLSARNHPNGGAEFTLILPVTRDSEEQISK